MGRRFAHLVESAPYVQSLIPHHSGPGPLLHDIPSLFPPFHVYLQPLLYCHKGTKRKSFFFFFKVTLYVVILGESHHGCLSDEV